MHWGTPLIRNTLNYVLQILAMETVLLVSSWFPFSVPHVMKLIFLPSSVFSPHDRVDTNYNILEVPHSLPIHWEAELVVPFEGCAVAIQELRRFVIDNHLPVNMPIEVSCTVANPDIIKVS